jgi:hypothetical protein
MGTFGHDTHDRSEPNDEDERLHAPGLFNDRRSEGRRHTPTSSAAQTNGTHGQERMTAGVKIAPSYTKRVVGSSGPFQPPMRGSSNGGSL